MARARPRRRELGRALGRDALGRKLHPIPCLPFEGLLVLALLPLPVSVAVLGRRRVRTRA